MIDPVNCVQYILSEDIELIQPETHHPVERKVPWDFSDTPGIRY